MSRPHVLQLDDFPSAHWEAFSQEVVLHRANRETVLQGELSEAATIVGLLCLITDRVDAALLERLPHLQVISNYGAGLEHIDLQAARRRGIRVAHTPHVLSDATADLTWGLILSVARGIVASDRSVRIGGFTGWRPDFQLGLDVCGKTLGIFGLGEIGQKVAQRAQGFDMPVLYHRRQRLSPADEARLGVTYRSFDALVAESDILSIHTPLTPETRHCFNREVFAQMRRNAILINTARGPVVDEAALVEALQTGQIAGAGLDVYEAEPQVHPGLLGMENVVLTAHIGSATAMTRQRMGDMALENLRAILAGRAPLAEWRFRD